MILVGFFFFFSSKLCPEHLLIRYIFDCQYDNILVAEDKLKLESGSFKDSATTTFVHA